MAGDTTSGGFDYSGPLSRKAVQLLRDLQGLRLFDVQIPKESGTGAAITPSNDASQAAGPPPMGAAEAAATSGLTSGADSLGASEPSFDPPVGETPISAGLDLNNLQIGQVLPKKKVEAKTNKLLSRFNRDLYLSDTRSTYAPRLVVGFIVFVALLAAVGGSTWQVLFPKLNAMKAELASIASAPSQLASLRQELDSKSKQQQQAQAKLATLQGGLLTPEQSLAKFAQFLASLRDGRVQLVTQRNTITQAEANPLAAGAPRGAAGPGGATTAAAPPGNAVSKTANTTGQASRASAQAADNLKGAPAAGAAPRPPQGQPQATASNFGQSPPPSAAIAQGLNYNHYELVLTGTYTGYIVARQTLVTMIPNIAIHYEEIGAMDQNPTQLNIRIYFSVPFFSK